MDCIGLSCTLSIESNEACVVKFEFSPLETLVHHEYTNVSSTEEEKPLLLSNKGVTQQTKQKKSPKTPKQSKTKKNLPKTNKIQPHPKLPETI